MSRNGGRRFGEGMAQHSRIQRLTDDLATVSIVLAEEWVMRGRITARADEMIE
jgi:hypothetical protein